MKNKLKFLLVAFAALTFSFSSCTKDKDNTASADYSSQFSTQADDDNQVSSEVDAVADDANTALENSVAMNGGRAEQGNNICDGTVKINVGNDTAVITYKGTSCDGKREREGKVILTLAGGKWKDAGAVLTINANLKVTRKSDNKTITLKGIWTVTNVNGGLVKELSPTSSTTSITHDIASNGVVVTFPNGSNRSWEVSRRRVITYDDGYVITITGTHTDGGNSNIAEWGTTREGDAFETSVTQPLVVRQDCNWRLVSGQIKHEKLVKEVTVTFGLDSAGNPTSCPGAGHFYFKVEWQDDKGNTKSAILPY